MKIDYDERYDRITLALADAFNNILIDEMKRADIPSGEMDFAIENDINFSLAKLTDLMCQALTASNEKEE